MKKAHSVGVTRNDLKTSQEQPQPDLMAILTGSFIQKGVSDLMN